MTTMWRWMLLTLVLLPGALIWAEKPAKPPVVEWKAGDAPDFRYRFLERVKTTELLHVTPETGTFSHHGFLYSYKGVLFASWDSQARDENTPGQHGVFRYSTDEGETWSDAKPFFPPLAENVPASETDHHNPFQVNQGFVEIDGLLYAVTNIDRALKEKVYRFNEASRIQIGLMARSVGVDGSLGEIFWLQENAPKPKPGFPAYPPGAPSLVAKLNAHFEKPANLPQLMFRPRVHPDSADGHRMNEPTPAWRLDDGAWVRFYCDEGDIHATNRAEVDATRSRRQYASFSFDDGKTWTPATRTNFPDSCACSNAGKLPDGQVYVINNIIPMAPRPGGLSMLAISLSRDCVRFDRSAVIRFVSPPQRHKGIFKSMGYQYPHSVVVGEHLRVIYSVNKEDIEVARIPLGETYAL